MCFFKVRVYNAGASSVVGLDLDYVELSSHKSMVMLVTSGTAVVIEDKKFHHLKFLFSDMGWNTAVNNCLLWFSGGSMLPELSLIHI